MTQTLAGRLRVPRLEPLLRRQTTAALFASPMRASPGDARGFIGGEAAATPPLIDPSAEFFWSERSDESARPMIPAQCFPA